MAKTPSAPTSQLAVVLSPEERVDADQIGAYRYIRSKRYRTLRDTHIADALKAIVATLEASGCPNPYDGTVLGAFAASCIRQDPKAVGYLSECGVAMKDKDKRELLFTYIGMIAAEKFLETHRKDIPKEAKLSDASRFLTNLNEMFEDMKHRA